VLGRSIVKYQPLVIVDGPFVAANMVKFFDGGWIPLVTAAVLYFQMTCWADAYSQMRRAGARNL